MSKRRRGKDLKGKEAPVADASRPVRSVPWWMYALRCWLVAMLATTLNLTWPLWGERETPPLLPLVPLPAFDDYGAVLIATAACFIFWPRTGLAAHVLVGLIAMIADQTRMQPQIFSFWLLMSATLPGDVPPLLGRSHLASLWFFSGFHKLLSPGYYRDVSSFLWSGLFPPAAVAALPDLSQALAASLAVVELLLGVAVFVPRWRRAAAVVAAMLHLGVLWILYRQQWNTSVWPWNWALAVAGPALIASWKRSVGEERRACGRVGFAACVALFFSPLLFYIGSLDPYLCHCLYSSNVPVATMYPAQLGGTPYQMNGLEGPYWRNLNVPQPPTHRNFELYFRAVAKPGDRMIVVDPRAWAAWAGCDRYEWRRTDTGIDRRPVEPTVLK